MVIYEKPWPHIVIENYYSDEVFAEIKKASKRFLKDNVDVNVRKQEFPFADDPALQKCIDSRPLDVSYLDILKNHRPHDDLKLFWEVNFLLGPHKYPIHDETPRKVLSCVVYVEPESNNGTYLYNEDKSYSKQIEWKPNTAFIFAAIDGVTWHDYDCPKGKLRITINQFLERPRDYEQIS